MVWSEAAEGGRTGLGPRPSFPLSAAWNPASPSLIVTIGYSP
jgi:hypothetical protein